MKHVMTEKSKRRIIIFSRVVRGIALCVAIFFSTLLLGRVGVDNVEELDLQKAGITFAVAMLVIALHEIFASIQGKLEEKKLPYAHLIYAAFYIIAGVVAFFKRLSSNILIISGMLFLLVPIVKRIISIIRNHKKQNVILNSIMLIIHILIFLVELACFGLDGELQEVIVAIIVGFVLLFTCLINIGLIVFSNLKIELLKKIIRKTYAGEILSGLLLFIISFSLAFMMLESSMNSFFDAIWYCFAIITTIGFGDFAATTVLGRILSIILGIYGIVVVSIITSIIVNFYNEVKTIRDDEEVESESLIEDDNIIKNDDSSSNTESTNSNDENISNEESLSSEDSTQNNLITHDDNSIND